MTTAVPAFRRSPGRICIEIALASLVDRYGAGVFADAARLKSRLEQACPNAAREVGALMTALAQRVPQRLFAAHADADALTLQPRLIKDLVATAPIDAEAAAWAVHAWAHAFALPTNDAAPVVVPTAKPDFAAIVAPPARPLVPLPRVDQPPAAPAPVAPAPVVPPAEAGPEPVAVPDPVAPPVVETPGEVVPEPIVAALVPPPAVIAASPVAEPAWLAARPDAPVAKKPKRPFVAVAFAALAIAVVAVGYLVVRSPRTAPVEVAATPAVTTAAVPPPPLPAANPPPPRDDPPPKVATETPAPASEAPAPAVEPPVAAPPPMTPPERPKVAKREPPARSTKVAKVVVPTAAPAPAPSKASPGCTPTTCGEVVSMRDVGALGYEMIVRLDDRSIHAVVSGSRWRAGTKVRMINGQFVAAAAR